MNRASKSLLMLLMLALLAACQTTRTTATTGNKAVCALWGDVTYSGSQDSEQTIAEVRALNAKRDAYCK